MSTTWWVIYTIAFSLILFFAYTVLKVYLLQKLKVNRWIIFTLALIVLIVPSFLRLNGMVWVSVQSGLFVMLFLWFMDLTKLQKAKEKEIKIKPKAKPNRVKNKEDKK
ncbi:hypothetical protein [Clostridium polynesiense]|uniref:hypothetical protein n=1 Tax=Clostridium polynesiense TaxID=1325933 RepID=UPI000694C002|nr:hypothetical protein [Clostridium polynesiense]